MYFNHPPRKIPNYKLINCIASTNSSCVYESTNSKLNKKVVLKFIPVFETNCEVAQNEVNIQSLIRHPFIMPVRNFDFTFKNNRYHVLEMPPAMCGLSSVHDFIKTNNTMYKIMYQVLSAIDFLHDMRILHGDIKPENIVLMSDNLENPEIRIIDFGHSHHFEEGEDMEKCILNNPSGTIMFNSPELLCNSPHSFPSDIWSLGATFYFLITGENIVTPDESLDKMTIYEEVRCLLLPFDGKKLGTNFPKNGRSLIRQMLSFDAAQRPTAKQCLESQFFIENLDRDWINKMKILINEMKNDSRFDQDEAQGQQKGDPNQPITDA